MTAYTRLENLKNASVSGELLAETTEISENIFLNADARLGLSGTFRSPSSRIVELDCSVTGAGDWCGLHVPLDLSSVVNISHLGFLCRMSAPQHWVIRPCLRSEDPNSGFRDCFFHKHMLTTERPHTHVDALHLDSHPDIPLTAEWRELIFFMPCESFSLSLQSLHVFTE